MVGVPFGLIDLRSEAQFASALRADMPTQCEGDKSMSHCPAAPRPRRA